MNEEESDDWQSRDKGNLIINEEQQVYFRHADLFLSNFEETKQNVLQALKKPLEGVKLISKEQKSSGAERLYKKRLTADSLNVALKDNLKDIIPNVKFEVEFIDGVFYDSPKTGGFDFAVYDDLYNVINFRNYCLGSRSISNGEKKWREILNKREDWQELSKFNDIDSFKRGVDMPNKKSTPTIIGEVQFGNWALFYYDLLKTIQIEQSVDIDLFIYITATGNLSKYISEGTVNFDKAKKRLEEFKNVIRFPVWLIGIDFE